MFRPFYISTFCSVCSSLMSCFFSTLLRYFLHDFEMFPVALFITGTTVVYYWYHCCLLLVSLLFFTLNMCYISTAVSLYYYYYCYNNYSFHSSHHQLTLSVDTSCKESHRFQNLGRYKNEVDVAGSKKKVGKKLYHRTGCHIQHQPTRRHTPEGFSLVSLTNSGTSSKHLIISHSDLCALQLSLLYHLEE